MPSGIAQTILDILEGAGRPMTVNHVSRQLAAKSYRGLSERKIERRIREDLQEHVKLVDGDRWALREAPPDASDEASPAEKQATGDEDAPRLDDLPLVARRVAGVLAEAAEPIKAHEIADRLEQKGFSADKSLINRSLYRQLEDFATHHENARWTLRASCRSVVKKAALREAVLQALRRQSDGGALPTSAVVTRLKNAARPEVADALVHLREAGQVERDASGRWCIAESTPSDNDSEEETAEDASPREREAHDRPRRTLGLSAQQLLDVLDGAAQPLSTERVATRRDRAYPTASSTDAAGTLARLEKRGRVSRDAQGRWRMPSTRTSGAATRDAGDTDRSEEKSVEERIVAVLEGAEATIDIGEVTARLNENGPSVEQEAIVERLHALYQRGRIDRDRSTLPFKWSAGLQERRNSKEDEEAGDEPSEAPAASEETQRERVCRALANADEPAGSSALARYLSEHGVELERGDVIKHLYRLRDAGRVTQDTSVTPFRWSVAEPDADAPADAGEADADEKEVGEAGAGLAEDGEPHVFDALADAPEAVSASDLTRRLVDAGTPMECEDVVAYLYQLRQKGRVLIDERFRWHVAQGAAAVEPEAEDDVSREDAPPRLASERDAAERETTAAQVFEALADAAEPQSGDQLARRLQADGHDTDADAVVEHLCRLREEGRALHDQRLGWYAVQERPASTPTGKPSQSDSTERKPPAFTPSGAAGPAVAALDQARQLALMLALSPRPLPAVALAETLTEAGFALTEAQVEDLLAGPLRGYARRDGKRGWTLDAGEAGPQDPYGQTPDEHLLAAQTRADGVEYEFVRADLDSPAFFAAEMKGAATVQVKLNDQHPAYDLLETALKVGTQEKDARTLRRLLRKAQRGLQLLLAGWTRHEHNLSGPRARRAREARSDWGRSVRRIVRRHEQSEQT